MFIHKIIQVGGSAGITIPKKFLKATNLVIGEKIALEMNTDSKTLLMKPIHNAGVNYYLTPEYFKWLGNMELKLSKFKKKFRFRLFR